MPLESYVTQQQTSRTYRLDPVEKRIVGMVDGLEALKQAVFLILETERFEHVIYSFQYGTEMNGLFGMNALLFSSELQRRIREALLQDDRIESVENVRIDFEVDSAVVQFDVVSIFGRFEAKRVVSRNGG